MHKATPISASNMRQVYDLAASGASRWLASSSENGAVSA
jgi:hypothetical protein